MTLKTEWVSDPKIRNDLSYLDIAVIGLLTSYSILLVLYALYLDTSVICKYFFHRLK